MHLELIKNHHGLIVQLLLAIVRSRYACIGRELGPVDQSGNPRPDSEQSKDSKQKEVQNLDIAVHSCTYWITRSPSRCSHPPPTCYILPVVEMAHSSNVMIHGSSFNSVQGGFHIHNRDSESGKHDFRFI